MLVVVVVAAVAIAANSLAVVVVVAFIGPGRGSNRVSSRSNGGDVVVVVGGSSSSSSNSSGSNKGHSCGGSRVIMWRMIRIDASQPEELDGVEGGYGYELVLRVVSSEMLLKHRAIRAVRPCSYLYGRIATA